VNVLFELNSGANIELNVYNLLGEKVMSLDLGNRMQGKHNVTLEKGNLSSGMYILQIDAGHMNRWSTKIAFE
jgi:hypothetical protein